MPTPGAFFWNVNILDEVGMDSTRGPSSIAELEELGRKALKTRFRRPYRPTGFCPLAGEAYIRLVGSGVSEERSMTPPRVCPLWNMKATFGPGSGYGSGRNATRPVNDSLVAGASGAAGYFVDGSLAATTAADNSVKTYITIAPDLVFRTGEIPHAEGGRNGTWGGGVGHIIPKGTKHPKEAKEFMRWIALEGMWILYQQLEQFPPHRQLADRAIRQLDRNDLRLPFVPADGSAQSAASALGPCNPQVDLGGE